MTDALTGQKPAVLYRIPCEQWFLPARRYAAKVEKPLRATVFFFDGAAVQRYERPWICAFPSSSLYGDYSYPITLSNVGKPKQEK